MTEDIDNICNEIRTVVWDINVSSHEEKQCLDKFGDLYDLIERLETKIVLVEKKNNSWEKIGKQLGVSKQAAWERFSKIC